MKRGPEVTDQDQATAEWTRRLEQDGTVPAARMVDGCISLFGPSPAYVFGYRSGPRWIVVAQEGQLIGQLTASLEGSSEDADEVSGLDAWILSLSELTEIRFADKGGEDETPRGRWTLKFRSGRKIRLPLRPEASSEESEITRRLVTQLRDGWAVPDEPEHRTRDASRSAASGG